MKNLLIILCILSAFNTYAKGVCTYKIFREGGDSGEGNTFKVIVQDIFRVKTIALNESKEKDETVSDCLFRANEIYRADLSDVNDLGRHEYPKVVVTYSGDDAEMKVVIRKKRVPKEQ